MGKKTRDRARSRRFYPFKILAGAPQFREAVYLLRTLTGASPQTRRDFEQVLLRCTPKFKEKAPDLLPITKRALYSCMAALFNPARWEEWIHLGPGAGNKYLEWFCTYKSEELRHAELPVSFNDLETAAFMDFEDIKGAEFYMWAEIQDVEPLEPPDRLIVFDDIDEWERGQKNLTFAPLFRPLQIYLNVTDLSLSGIEELWPWIERWQARLGRRPHPPKSGRPLGLAARRKTALGLTWGEMRAGARRDPSDHAARLEKEHTDAEVRRKEKQYLKGHTEVPNRLKLKWRRQAKDNFYRRVIVHPSMRDLNLRPRRRGRPRKS